MDSEPMSAMPTDAQGDDEQESKEQDDSKLSPQDKQVIEIAEALYENRPMLISLEERSKEIFKEVNGLRHCFSIVLLQE